jgi:ubiquinone/menaquinone biosynthesis C-methylase UbiE
LGCGGGYYTHDAARFVGPTGRVRAIDISPDQIAAAQARCAEFAWVECREADIAAPPYGNAEFDVVYAVQALEYLADLDGALRHIHRMLRAGGRLIIVATDWSSAVWHSENASRMQRVLSAFAPHIPRTNLPSILAARLRRAGIQPLRQTPIPILNTSYNPARFSYWAARVVKPFVVSRGSVTEEESTEWFEKLAKLEENGAYFFCITPILTEAKSGLTGVPAMYRRVAAYVDTPDRRDAYPRANSSSPDHSRKGMTVIVCQWTLRLMRRLAKEVNALARRRVLKTVAGTGVMARELARTIVATDLTWTSPCWRLHEPTSATSAFTGSRPMPLICPFPTANKMWSAERPRR